MHSKEQAQYTNHGSRTEYCGICTNFQAPSDCKVVEGKVVAGGWCQYFNKREFGKTKTIKLKRKF